MRLRRFLFTVMALGLSLSAVAQAPAERARTIALESLLQQGFSTEDLGDLIVKDDYVSTVSSVRHVYLRQRWQGIEVWNGDIAVHLNSDGSLLTMNNGAWSRMSKRVNTTTPAVSAETALANVLAKTASGVAMPALISTEENGRLMTFDGSALGNEPMRVRLMLLPVEDKLRLVWNVNHYTADGSHWWNVRIDAVTGDELDRNDWVSQCNFDEAACEALEHGAPPEAAPMPLVANDLNVYPMPVESPNHGPRAIRNAPWTAGGIASPYGWNDTNGAAGAEFTTTRGNNVWAQEDANNNNGTGASPVAANLDFDYTINLAGAPSTYQNAAITNLYYWNSLMHDVWYPYGFDDPSGNFQSNNYGRGGTGNDYVLADAQDGGGTNNANFGTPPEGSSPRMQMYVWTYTTPNRDGDIDNGVVAHEYAHGISNRLVGGPANVNCLTNAEQMGEGWSDWAALMMTIEPGDQGTDRRGIGTYVTGQGVTGGGIRPAPYSTDFAQNNYTYAATNNAAIAVPHGIGFVWCTILWEVTWELINTYGYDPNIYSGTGGNNIAMHLVIEGMKLTPCGPGFVDARNAILNADASLYGGTHTTALWNAFARRGLGVSANQGSAASRSDQTEAYDTPTPNNVGVSSVLTPAASATIDCTGGSTIVSATVRNFGSNSQTNFPVRYRLDAGAWVAETFTATIAAGASATFTFATPLVIGTTGAHTVTVSTLLSGDSFVGNDQASSSITVANGTIVPAPFSEGLAVATIPAPAGWRLENPDGLTTWTTTVLTNGINCGSTRAWSIDNYNYDGVGQEDRLVTPRINLTGLTACQLRFDRAFAPYGAGYYDGFRVDISNNCGASWTTLYNASGVALATTAANTAAWAPTNCSQWQTNTINISAYNGQTVEIRFVGINAFGNFFYFDNVQVSGSSTLPVELLDLNAWPNSRGILLTWTTATELNSERYDIERTVDGTTWTRIGTQAAAGNSMAMIEYDFLDEAPKTGVNYYRLHMFDLDGSQTYSSTVSAEWKDRSPLCYPNPSDGSFWVSIAAGTSLDVIDALGQSVPYSRTVTSEGRARIDLLQPVTGLYLVRIGSGADAVIERVMLTGR